MYKLHGEAVETANELRSLVMGVTHCEMVVAPVFTAIKAVSERLGGIKCFRGRSELFDRD